MAVEPFLADEPDEDAGLPTAGDTLFDANATRSNFACYDRAHDWYHYVNGYKEAADFLVSHLDELHGHAYKLGPPVTFLYRQHLELAIKQLTINCADFLGCPDTFVKTHRLDQIWRQCLSLLGQVSAGTVASEEVQQATRLIEEFHRVDPDSVAFRYPEDKGKPPQPPRPPLVRLGDVDLHRVCEVVGKISSLLECISMELDALKSVSRG